MALYLQARDGGKTDEKGLYYHINKLFPGEVVSGFTVTQQDTPNMGVKVAAGSIMVPSGNDYPYIGWNDASANLTVTAADVSNPRRDLVVAYVDLSVVSSVTPNNPNALKLAVVAGTPAGSPSDPNDAAIHAVIGVSNPYSILSRVAVAAGASTITNAVITDLRTFAVLGTSSIGDGVITKSKLEKPHFCSQYFSTGGGSGGQVITSTETQYAFDTTDANAFGITSTLGAASYMTVTRDGIYKIDHQVTASDAPNGGTGFICWLEMSTNSGSTWIRKREFPRTINVGEGQSYSITAWLAANTRVRVTIYNGTGSIRLASSLNTAADRYWSGPRVTVTEVR